MKKVTTLNHSFHGLPGLGNCQSCLHLTSLRDDLRGCEYLPLVARTLANKEIQKHFLSRDIWLYEISEAA
jgi:hypothetical protein